MKNLKVFMTTGILAFNTLAFGMGMGTETSTALGTLGTNSPKTSTGITAPAPIISDRDLQQHEVTTIRDVLDVLENVRENRYTYPLQEMINRATQIVSNAKAIDYAAGYVLSKATTVVDQTIRNAGSNEDFLGSFFQSYMEVAFNLGAKFLLTPGCSSMSNEKIFVSLDFERCTKSVPNHIVAISVAQDLWKYSASLITSTAEAVMVIHALDALKTGVNDNVYRNDERFKDLWVRIDQIEKTNYSYSNVVRSITNFQEPVEQDVNNVRYELLKIFERIPDLMAVK